MTEESSQPPPPRQTDVFRLIFDTFPDAMIVVDESGLIVHSNPKAEELFGYARETLEGVAVELLLPPSLRASHARHRAEFAGNRRIRPMDPAQEFVGVRADGTHFPVEIGLSSLNSGEGQLFVACIRDSSKTHRAIARRIRNRYDSFALQASHLVLETSTLGRIVDRLSALVASALGFEVAVLMFDGVDEAGVRERVSSAAAERLGDELRSAFSSGELMSQLKVGDGAVLVLRELPEKLISSARKILEEKEFRDAAIAPLVGHDNVFGVLLLASRKDIELDRDASHFLQSIANILVAAVQRSRFEKRLVHTQRLEAIGQVTKGIAHDFNNLLTVISGNLQLLEAEQAGRSKTSELVDSAQRAVERGAILTHKLLAFSGRQVLNPRATDPHGMLGDLSGMLRRTLGADITLVVECPDDVAAARVDPAEFETALLNLVLNARDAMPEGGHLTISVSEREFDADNDEIDVQPGSYLAISVTDTGAGMEADVRERSFEPFFTTRDRGGGGGLGLSTAYGFALQSGGGLTIESKPGAGTRVTLYLPMARPEDVAIAPAGAQPAFRAEREAILVVEDEADVRKLAVIFLRSLGYTTFEADSADSARALFAEHPEIELVFSDISLGGDMSGIDLLREMQRERPHLRALFCSGFDGLTPGIKEAQRMKVELLRKPYRYEQLGLALRRTLDRGNES
jgi:PAS domain S-box-containing protein